MVAVVLAFEKIRADLNFSNVLQEALKMKLDIQ